jgi:hypothetical protein
VNRWLQIVWPRWTWLLIAVLPYAFVEGLTLRLEWKAGMAWRAEPPRPSLLVLSFAAVIWGFYRVFLSHPLRPGYGAWLATTPWQPGKPLPLGPVALAWQDALLLSPATAVAWLSHGHWALVPPLLFLGAYSACLAIQLVRTGEPLAAYAVGFGLGLAVRLWPDFLAALAVTTVTCGVAHIGLRRSLRRFPWQISPSPTLPPDVATVIGGQGSELGWPFGSLGPKVPDADGLPLRHALLASALAGWWLHVTTMLVTDRGGRLSFLSITFLGVLTIVPLIRLGRYCAGYDPPISFWGRLLTGRWVIKGYDQVYVAPLLSFWVGVTVVPVGFGLGLDPEIYLPVSMAVAVAICLGMGPDLKTWRLTGHHRISPAPTHKTNAIQVS